MEISGKVIKILPLVTGEGKNGVWKKQEFVIEVPGQFPKKVCLSLWGEKVTQYPLKEGAQVSLNFDLESREYSNRWYTEARVWKISYPEAPGNDSSSAPGNATDKDAFSSLSDNDVPGSDNFLSRDIEDDNLPF